ncbi:MAG TPA: CPBP family intramembrane glutamic endopeptidase [Caulobacteraceae bacterium]|jgi:membrane protease YdiL (CAAX protease family)|nr:CPBP family intramembrane glutamic endopeptidase [Caulobacteraceae bacterium]
MVINPKGVIAYLLLAFGIAWTCWEIPIRFLHLDVTSAQFQLFALPGAFAPAIAALIVRAFSKDGWKDAKFRLPVSKWPYFLFALVLPLLILPVMVVEAKALGYLPAGFDLMQAVQGVVPATGTPGQSIAAAQMAKLGALMIPALLLMAIVTTPILWGEEFGWRGYLQPRLLPGRPVAQAIVTGIIWSAWHWPLILRGYDYGHDQAVMGCVALTVGAILFSFIFGWLVERTGSIWSSSLAHAATNGVGGSISAYWFASAHNDVVMSYAGALAWPPMLVVCLLILLFGRRKTVAGP